MVRTFGGIHSHGSNTLCWVLCLCFKLSLSCWFDWFWVPWFEQFGCVCVLFGVPNVVVFIGFGRHGSNTLVLLCLLLLFLCSLCFWFYLLWAPWFGNQNLCVICFIVVPWGLFALFVLGPIFHNMFSLLTGAHCLSNQRCCQPLINVVISHLPKHFLYLWRSLLMNQNPLP